MARWKLAVSHYLNVPGTEWEYSEADRSTGRPVRRKFSVPRLLDIRDPQDWTNKWGNNDNAEGEIIVCHEGKGEPKDVVFIGDPSPDMIPVDDEAIAITNALKPKWEMRPEILPGDYSQSLVDKFQIQMQDADAKAREAGNANVDKVLNAMTELMQQNAMLIASLANKPAPNTDSVRRA